ncbi:MAG TPA: copper amine oxidase N-terminal domain-containing protein [Candidatus Rubrimentiphilum sp.]|nr:copper amine oxidase N-terminal domain-containing protein [Candidatus Rubrimentiphilum sp.]
MKRLSTGVLAALLAAGLGLSAVAAPSQSGTHGNLGPNVIAQTTPAPPPPMNFGSPPSGQIPILYNDHHVYAKPDELKQGRVLAALVRGGTILIPLRSMFEQMGATVSWDPASKTADVSKPGADVKVTVGRPEVVINGETRPLDVPPEMYQGHVVVPVRVISEGMGAYVQWVPDKRLVVVRYIPPTPPPPPTVTATPSPAPVITPTPVPAPYMDHFIAGDYIISPKVYNEFSPGNTGSNTQGGFSYRIHGAWEFNLINLPWMVAGDYRQFNYPHNQGVATTAANAFQVCDGLNGHAAPGDTGCVTTIGGNSMTFIPAFIARQYEGDARLGLKVLDPRIYIGVGYLWQSSNYGYPHLNNWGFGVEKLPDLNQSFTWFGSAYYYPNVQGTGTACIAANGCVPPGVPYTLAYNVLRYDLGAAVTFGANVPVYVEFGFLGSSWRNKQNAPANESFAGPYGGLGIKF